MAGDWIKIEHATVDKEEIVAMAGQLGIDHDAVVGKCLRLWIWADQQSVDGCALSVTKAFIDRLVFAPGFSDALRKVGWLEGRDGHLSIPGFARHNGESAKKRALSKKRNAALRKRDAESVTQASPEKRREEKSIEKGNAKPPDSKLNQLLNEIPLKVRTNRIEEAVRFWADKRSEGDGDHRRLIGLDAITLRHQLAKLDGISEPDLYEVLADAGSGGWKSLHVSDRKTRSSASGKSVGEQSMEEKL